MSTKNTNQAAVGGVVGGAVSGAAAGYVVTDAMRQQIMAEVQTEDKNLEYSIR